ncbi:conserved protein [Tepidicaulis marinus]|uniref:Conserved protein n=1 Tax=Tepidicaulis marinus TaxID=1333998 RepID=A0A081BA66_9HYPH|nr:DUF2145 domain-containing protein [Tepidicaulis marinus]GAK44934.1 conserved protein [Tepidicaulis marinus]
MFDTRLRSNFVAAVFALLVSVVCALLPDVASANSSAAPEGIKDPERVLPFAKKVERELAARGARVAIVARVGRDPESLPDGIDYTHVGIWIYSDIETEDGRTVRGYAVHNLYQFNDDLSRSSLQQDFPPDFFADVFAMRAGITIPSPELQDRLVAFVSSPSYAKLHVPNYSLVANPYDTAYQNCTNFVLSTLIGAIHGTDDLSKVIEIAAESGYEPQKVELNGLQRAFGPLFVAGFETDDHDGDIRTSTLGSITKYLQAQELVDASFVIEE